MPEAIGTIMLPEPQIIGSSYKPSAQLYGLAIVPACREVNPLQCEFQGGQTYGSQKTKKGAAQSTRLLINYKIEFLTWILPLSNALARRACRR